ncbi:MAG: hypothetical protein OEW12_01605 [Deltaproteobacteria bacterium]|nr:hypothetical protein [Deltaproteobacteria bacterium]
MGFNRPDTPVVRNCYIPPGLLYETRTHLWFRREPGPKDAVGSDGEDGLLTLGLSDMAQTAAGKILHFTPKTVGRVFLANKPVALLEAAKWLGVLRLPFDVRLEAVNLDVVENPFLVNRFPYTRGWVLRVAPMGRPRLEDHLLTADQAMDVYGLRFEEWGLTDCVHCLGFET